MGRDQRRAIIQQLEQKRESKLLTYVTGDRQPATAQIGDDALRPIYEHLRSFGKLKRLDVFIYSRGGAIVVPWRIVRALRSAADEWNLLVPFRANSAATLVALGADRIILGQQGELGAIDPTMNIQRFLVAPDGGGTVMQDQVSVEDAMAYVRFVSEKAGLSDQAALSNALSKLAERLDAVSLGRVYRTHSHIRDVARRILLSRKNPASEQALSTIVETLAERVYAHGHAIGLKEASEIGLPAEAAAPDVDQLMWDLLGDYEDELKLLSPIDPAAKVATTDVYTEDATIAVVESATAIHRFQGRVEIRAKRQVPPTLNVTMNLTLQLPPTINVQQLPQVVQQSLQQMLQQAQQALLPQAQQAVQQALVAQAPLIGFEAGFREGLWVKGN